MPDRAAPHPWHAFDVERGLEVRQSAPEDADNAWDLRDVQTGRMMTLDESDFSRLREDPTWNPFDS